MKRLALLLLVAQPVFALDFHDRRALTDAAAAASPTLARLRAEAEAARERVGPASELPDPMVMAGIQNKEIDLSDDPMMTMYMVGASQTIVRPSKREARRNAAELEARAAALMIAAARAELDRDVLLLWWELAAVDAQLATASAVREMIDAIVAAARVRYEAGTSAQADVIRAQLEASNLEHEVLRLRGERRSVLARLLPLVDLPLATEVPPVALPREIDSLADSAPVAPPADHPAIAALEAEVAAREEMVRLMRLERKPDVDIEAQYGFRRSERDMFSVVARIELPFLRSDRTIEPRVREQLALRDAAKTRIDELRRELTQQLAEAVAMHTVAAEQMRLHDEVLMPQTRLAFDSTLAAYQTGKAPFDAILATETDYLRLHLDYYGFRLRHARAAVTYDALRRGAGRMR